MKSRFILIITVLSLALVSLGAGILPTLADESAAAVQLPWDFDVVIGNSDVSRIGVSIDAYTMSPMITFYDWDTNMLKAAIYRGSNYSGNCGEGNHWYCALVGSSIFAGKYHAVDYFYIPNPTNNRHTGFLIYEQAQNSLEYVFRYAYTSLAGQSNTRIIDFNEFCTTACSITSAVSLAFDENGYAHAVAVVDTEGDDHLLYFHEVSAGGNCDLYGGSDAWEVQTVLAEPNGAKDPSITIMPTAAPRIAYYRPADSSLRYAYPSSTPNCDAGSDWRCLEIDDLGSTGQYPSIAYGSALHIAYFNAQTGYIWLAKYIGQGGNCGVDGTFSRWQCEAIDNVGTLPVQHGISLVMDGSTPVIAYMDANDGSQSEVKIAQPVERAGLDTGNCGPQDLFQTWYCQTLDQGAYSLGSEIEMMVDSGGALFLGYLEDNYDAYEVHLLSARQYYKIHLPLIRKP